MNHVKNLELDPISNEEQCGVKSLGKVSSSLDF